MSDFVIHKGRRASRGFARSYGASSIGVTFSPYEPTTVALSDGRSGAGSCLGCGTPPCIEKDPSELTLFGALEAFPGDPSLDVCPTGAINWDPSTESASVRADQCIGCGLCVSRCPYGAIGLVDGVNARVESADPDRLITAGPTQGEHCSPDRSGVLGTLDAPAATQIPASIETLGDSRTNIFIRNLLHELGINARNRRRGDTNVRVDAVGYSRSERPFVAEFEMGVGVLDSPRALLEDVAILHSRYGYEVTQIDAVSVILAFPNLRSEYYQVLRDIEKVVGLRCRTLTIGSLIALLWNCRQLDGFGGDAFAVKEGVIDISGCLGLSGESVIEPYPGAFTPAK